MTTPTPDNNTGPINEFGVDVDDNIRASASAAESEIFLQHLLGVNINGLPADANARRQLSATIARRILSREDATRRGIGFVELGNILDQNIEAALAKITNIQRHDRRDHLAAVINPDRLRVTRAIAEAVRMSVPQALLDDVVRYGMPIGLDAHLHLDPHFISTDVVLDGPDPDGRSIGHRASSRGIGARVSTRAERTVKIDTRHKFWREEGPFNTLQEMAAALKGRKIIELGINTYPSDLPHSYAFTEGDANRLARSAFTVVDVHNRYDNYEVALPNAQLRVNVDQLVATAVTVPGLTLNEQYIGELNCNDLVALFESDPPNFPYWQSLVQCNPQVLPTDIIVPGLPNTYARTVAEGIFNQVGRNVTDTLAVNSFRIHEVQKEIKHQHQYNRRLREDSTNPYGASLASAILMKYKDCAGVLGKDVDKADIEKKVKDAETDSGILLELGKLSSLSVPTVAGNLQDIEDKIADINLKIGTVAISSTIDIYPGPERFVVGSEAKDVDAVRTQLRTRMAELQKIRSEYSAMAQRMLFLAQAIIASRKTVPPSLRTYIDVTGGTPPIASIAAATNFVPNINLQNLIADITSVLSLKKKEDYDKEIEENKKKLKDIDSQKPSGPHGDAAQQAVIEDYLIRYHGMSQTEATAGANYLRTRSNIDTNLASTLNAEVEQEYGAETSGTAQALQLARNALRFRWNGAEAVNGHIIGYIAQVCGIPGRAGSPVPDWSHVNDTKRLYQAFYVMRKLLTNDPDLPMHMRLQRTQVVEDEMRSLARVIVEKDVYAMQRIAGPGSDVDPTADEESRKMGPAVGKATIQNRVDRLMHEEPSDAYKPLVDQAIDQMAVINVWEAVRHKAFGDAKKSLARGRDLPFSLANLGWRNEHASLYGLAKFQFFTAPKWIATKTWGGVRTTAQAAWNNKWKTVGGLGGFFAGGPIGALLGVGAMHVMGVDQKKSPGGGN